MNPNLSEWLSARALAQDPTFQTIARAVIKSKGKNKSITSFVTITVPSIAESFTLGWFEVKGVTKLKVTLCYFVQKWR